MRDLGTDGRVGTAAAAAVVAAPTVAEIEAFVRRLAADGTETDDAVRIDRIAALESLRAAAEAAQTETVADFALSQRMAAADRGVPAARRDRGVGAQVALARSVSPTRGQQHVSLALVLRAELAYTRAAFRAGRIDAFKATLIARETACLSAEHRALVDEELCASPETVERLSPRQLVGRLLRAAAELDPAAVAERRRRAERDRHTSLRPAPDTMTWFGALLPVKDGVAVHATLDRDARAAKADGDERSVGQLMADLLVERVTGSPAGSVPVVVNVLVRDGVVLGDDDGTGWVEGAGPVPGDLLRQWVADNLDTDTEIWLRRLYEQPATGHLVAMDCRATFFQGRLAEFLRLRDRTCRTPGCGAPVRHLDHVEPRVRGGPTSAQNGQGLCELCNYVKEADGWTARTVPGPRHTVEITTPTGHTYTSTADVL